MRALIVIVGITAVLSACTEKTAYEAAVEDLEPSYCYQSIGGVTCYANPYHRDARRLVNYYGPAPIRYGSPEPAVDPIRTAPAEIDFWVKDPEPVPTIAPKGDLSDRPWLLKTDGLGDMPASENGGNEAFLRDVRENVKANTTGSSVKLEAQTF